MHFINKLLNTIHILSCLALARLFGHYEHSGFNGDYPYAKYYWRGKPWIIPTGPCESDQ